MARHKLNVSMLSDTDLSQATAFSKWIRTENLDLISIQIAWTGGTAAGAFSVQTSNDEGDDRADPGSPVITNITTQSGSSTTISGTTASPIEWDFDPFAARWVRVAWARTGGTGTWTSARINGKGAG